MRTLKRHIFISALLLSIFGLLLSSCSSIRGTQKKQDELTVLDTVKATGLLIEAKKQQLMGNHQQASELYSELISMNPSDPVPYYEMARMHRMYKRFDQGLRHVKKAAELDPENKWYSLLQAELHIELMQFEEAAKLYGRVLEANTDEPDLYIHYATALSNAGEYKEAIAVYDQLEEAFGINEDVSFQKYQLFLRTKNIDGAIGVIQSLIDSSPSEIRYHGALAELYTSLERYDDASKVYEQMLAIDPDNPYIQLALADFYDATGKEDSVNTALIKAFRSPRLDIDSKMQILLDMYGQGDDLNSDAFILIDTLLASHPGEAKAWSIYGDFLLRDARISEARDAFRKVTDIDSLRYPVWEQLLLLDSKLDDHEAMVSEGKTAMRLFPEQAIPYLLTGAGLVFTKEYTQAIRTLERGLYFVSNETLESQFNTYLGEAYYKNGNFNSAFRIYDKLLEQNPENPAILNNYSYQLAEQGMNLDKADSLSAIAVRLNPGDANNMDTRAWVLFRKKNYTAALEWIEKALDAGGEGNMVLLEHYGDILFHLDRSGEALIWWQKARELGAGSPKLDEKLKLKTYVE